PIYGTTAEHVISLEIVMADGRIEKIGPSHESLHAERVKIEELIRTASTEMVERWSPGLIKRWPGYGIERFLRAPNDLTNILAGCIGPAKPVAFIEDAAVRPAQLPEYVHGLQSIMKPLGLEASYYGHAASGLLHVRPVLDLHSAGDLKKFRQVADQTSALVRQ